jgi:hypothetical protein
MTTILTFIFAVWITLCFAVCILSALVIAGGRGDQRDEDWHKWN